MQSNQLVPTTSTQDFLNYMANLESKDMKSAPRPLQLSLHGKTGFYLTSKWNEEKKEREDVVFGTGGGFIGTVLATRYFVQSKFKPDAPKFFKTREFSSFENDEIVLLAIEPKAEEKVKEIATYHDYHEFKEKKTVTDADTGETSYNYDLHVSLYIYVHEIDQVVNLQMKGTSRSAWFDYNRAYRKGFPEVVTMVQVKTEFGRQEEKNENVKGEPMTYYRATMATVGKNTEADLIKLMEATRALFDWMNGWQRQNEASRVHVIQEPVTPPPAELNKPLTEMEVLAMNPPAVDPKLEQDVKNLPF